MVSVTIQSDDRCKELGEDPRHSRGSMWVTKGKEKKKLNCIFRIIIIDPILKILSLPQLIDEKTEAQRG